MNTQNNRRILNLARFRNTRRVASRRGMTLVEIMVVVIIMAMIATAVGFAVLPNLNKAKVDSTRTDAQTIRSAVELYLTSSTSCPSVEDLVRERILNSSTKTKDAWDHDFVIECNGNDITVSSNGPDGQAGSEDDISTN